MSGKSEIMDTEENKMSTVWLFYDTERRKAPHHRLLFLHNKPKRQVKLFLLCFYCIHFIDCLTIAMFFSFKEYTEKIRSM